MNNSSNEQENWESLSPKVAAKTILQLAKYDFNLFHSLLASEGIEAVEGSFISGEHIRDMCQRMQDHPKTVTMAFRNASKSITFRSYIMWRLFTASKSYEEYSYFSYTQDKAGDHLKKTKRYISHCRCFKDYTNLTDAGTILRYKTPEGNIWECYPSGIMAFKRGEHRDGVILDDILKDATDSLDLSQIEKITRIIREEVLSIPKLGGWLHLAGTPQDQSDIFYQLRDNPEFNYAEYPAERNINGVKTATWPELFPLDVLESRRLSGGNKAYQKEYLLMPVRSAECFFSQEEIIALTDYDLKNNKPGGKPKDYGVEDIEVYAGMDLGKKRHPSHLSVWAKKPTASGWRYEQLMSKWFDGINYTEQLDYAKQAIESFGIIRLRYDNTRAEFESLDEMGEIPRQMEPVTMTRAGNFQAASALDRAASKGELRFVPDDRQLRQLCIVDNDLKAPETAEGHGDAFFSTSLAIQAATEEIPKPSIIF